MTPSHVARLVEVHEITVPAPGDMADVRGLLEICRRAAVNWASEVGADVANLVHFGGSSELDGARTPELSSAGGVVGIRFELVIGQGTSGEELAPESATAGWAWSARWAHWCSVWAALRSPTRARASLLTDMLRDKAGASGEESWADVIDLDWARAKRAHIVL